MELQILTRPLQSISKVCMILCTAFLFSCEKNITVDLPQPENKIVVEGSIEPGKSAIVFLSKNAPYFSPVDSATLLKYIVKGAIVTVSNGSTTDTLKELLPSFGYYYQSFTMVGEYGKTYDLTVVADGITLTASTTIPQPIPVDSLWFKPLSGQDSLGYMWCHFTDPPAMGDNYRFQIMRIGKDPNFMTPRSSVFEDRFVNGKSFDFFFDRPGKPTGQEMEDGYFRKGEIIVLKWSTIDRATFDFWRTAEISSRSGGNPFSSPATVRTNIHGKGLGIWAGYGVTYDTLIVK